MVVLGAGLAGLVAARDLAAAGADVTVLDDMEGAVRTAHAAAHAALAPASVGATSRSARRS